MRRKIGALLIVAVLFGLILYYTEGNNKGLEDVIIVSFGNRECTPNDLTKVNVNTSEITYDEVEAELSLKLQNKIRIGGVYSPEDCINLKKVAIVIPFRDRWQQLNVFLRNMHPIFVKQKISYQLFVIDQVDEAPFSRATLFNVGFHIANMIKRFDCFIFHDLDLLSEDERNMYDCPMSPLHMGAYIDIYKYNILYDHCIGGAIAMRYDHYMLINGHSNCYWGWGAEDDDLLVRFNKFKLKYLRVNRETSHYVMNMKDYKRNDKDISLCRYKVLRGARGRVRKDGINNINYQLLSLEYKSLFTYAKVNLTKQWLISKTDACN